MASGREWLLDLANIELKDENVEAICQERVELHKQKTGKRDELDYQEVDASQNSIGLLGCKTIVDASLQCQDLRVVKMSSNQLTDRAAPLICRLLQGRPALEQLHLSYNQLTAEGASSIISAAHHARSSGSSAAVESRDRGFPLWLRLEHNRVHKPTEVLEALRRDGTDFCEARDTERCGPRTCKRHAKIHLPYFSKQEEGLHLLAGLRGGTGSGSLRARAVALDPEEAADPETPDRGASSSRDTGGSPCLHAHDDPYQVCVIEDDEPPVPGLEPIAQRPAAEAPQASGVGAAWGEPVAAPRPAAVVEVESVGAAWGEPVAKATLRKEPATALVPAAKADLKVPPREVLAKRRKVETDTIIIDLGQASPDSSASTAPVAAPAASAPSAKAAASPAESRAPKAPPGAEGASAPSARAAASPAESRAPKAPPGAGGASAPSARAAASPVESNAPKATERQDSSKAADGRAAELKAKLAEARAQAAKAAGSDAAPSEASTTPAAAAGRAETQAAAAAKSLAANAATAGAAPKSTAKTLAAVAAAAGATPKAAPKSASAAAAGAAPKAAANRARGGVMACEPLSEEQETRRPPQQKPPPPAAEDPPASAATSSRASASGAVPEAGRDSRASAAGAVPEAADESKARQKDARDGEDQKQRKKDKKSKKDKDKDRDKAEKKRKLSSECSASEGRRKKKEKKHAREGVEAKQKSSKEAKEAKEGGGGTREAKEPKDAKSAKERSRSREAADRREARDRDARDDRDSKPRKEAKERHPEACAPERSPPSSRSALAFKPVQVMRKTADKDRPAAAAKVFEPVEDTKADGKDRQQKAKDGKDGAKDAKGESSSSRREKGDDSKPEPKVKGVALDLGNLKDIQKRLEEERNKLRLWVIKAKQDWEERAENAQGEKKAHQAIGATDDEDYYRCSDGEVFGPNKEFKCEGSIGNGVFSSVFRAKHLTEGTDYAIKFVRANTMMRKAAEKEVEVYRKLQRTAAAGSKKDQEACQYLMFLSQPESFVHKGHMCMVFTLQKCDLRTALQKYGQGRGLPMQTVVQYSRQLFTALRVLRQWGVIHGDLKPDNVLLSMAKTEIKVCDFGSAFEVADQIKTAYMQPRYYRAPEVIVGHPYDTQVDLWSVAVTLFELASGKILFTGRSNNAMLRQMLEVCGPYSRKLSTTGAFSAKHFSSDGDFIFKDPSTIIGQEVMPMKRFSQPGRHISSMLDKVLKEPPPNSDPKTQEKLLPKLADLVSKCLVWDAEERVIPETALEHAFFKKEK